VTHGERLARIEAILERIDSKLDTLEDEQRADIAELAALKNRGVGLLVGVGLAGSAVGATVARYLEALWK
jgi:Tfp pilus assembly ATPase PilU